MKAFLAFTSNGTLLGIMTLALIGALTSASRPVEATPAMAKTTGQACNACHTTPPALNAIGKAYKASGKLPSSGRN